MEGVNELKHHDWKQKKKRENLCFCKYNEYRKCNTANKNEVLNVVMSKFSGLPHVQIPIKVKFSVI